MSIITEKFRYDQMKEQYFITPNWIMKELTELDVTLSEFVVYMYLIRLNNNSENPFPSYQNIMDNTMLSSTSTVSRAIKGLESKGLIKKLHKGKKQGDSNIYQVNYIYPEGFDFDKCFGGSEEVKETKKANNSKATIPFKRGVGSDGMTPNEREALINSFVGYEEDYSSFDLI